MSRTARRVSLAAGVALTLAALAAVPALALHRARSGFLAGGSAIARLADRLDLTTEQREAARAVLTSHARPLATQIDAVAVARRSLFATIHAPQLDEGAVRAAAAAVATAETELALTRARIASELRPLLTDDQRAELALLREDASGLIDLVLDRVRARLLALAS